jgi:hypothetical protein
MFLGRCQGLSKLFFVTDKTVLQVQAYHEVFLPTQVEMLLPMRWTCPTRLDIVPGGSVVAVWVAINASEHKMPFSCYAEGMIDNRRIARFLCDCLGFIFCVCRGTLLSRKALVIENVALRTQLSIYEHDVPAKNLTKHRPTPAFRRLWVIISRFCRGWESLLIVVRPVSCTSAQTRVWITSLKSTGIDELLDVNSLYTSRAFRKHIYGMLDAMD